MLPFLKDFMKNNIDDNFTIMSLTDKNKLPLFLRNNYNFYEINILGESCIMLELVSESPKINSIKKNISTIHKYINKEIVLYFQELSPHRRKSLITNRISFIEGKGQFFLPFLGLLINGYSNQKDIFSEEKISFVNFTKNKFTPIAQVAYLYFLYNKKALITNNKFANLFNITAMSASRALNELYNNNLVTFEIGGKTSRSKNYRRIDDPNYYQIGKTLLINPIKKIVYVEKTPNNSFISGFESLSYISMINPIDYKVRAISNKNYINQNISIVKNEDIINDKNLIQLEIWNYDPKLFAKGEIVDILSLYTSLQDIKDERVEKEFDELLKKESWYLE